MKLKGHITVSELARRWDCLPRSINQRIKRGTIKVTRIGKYTLINEKALKDVKPIRSVIKLSTLTVKQQREIGYRVKK